MAIHLCKLLFGAVVLDVCFSSALVAEDQMVKSIMLLRSEVEALYTQIDNNKDAYKAQMKSYALQISDNEAQINRESTGLKLTQQNILKTEQKLAQGGNATEDLIPIIEDAIKALENEIKMGIPFKTDERLAALTQIRSDLKSKSITQEKALALTWANYDDTMRMTKEIGQFKQEIILDGKPVMAKIAKIGSVMMFFATPDDRVGYVKQKGGVYEYVIAEEEAEREQIVNLFDSLQKQIRTGFFTLPNALLLRGAK